MITIIVAFFVLVVPLALLVGLIAFVAKAIPAFRKTWASRGTWR